MTASSACYRISVAFSTVVLLGSVAFVAAFLLLDIPGQSQNQASAFSAGGGGGVMAHNRHQFVQDGASAAEIDELYARLGEPEENLGPIRLSANGHRMRIKPVFQTDGLRAAAPDKAQYLEDVVIPLSIEALTRTFSLKYPSVSPLRFQRKCRRTLTWTSGQRECNELFSEASQPCGPGAIPSSMFDSAEVCTGSRPGDCRTVAGGAGAANTDYVLVVTASGADGKCDDMADSGDMRAQGGFCVTDDGAGAGGDSGRPLAGFINFCPQSVSTDVDDLGKQVDLAVHEILHSLVFEPSLSASFKDARGQPYPYNPIQTSVDPTTGNEQRRVVTPKVREFVREHFDCDSLQGADLENQGGSGTRWSHWEESLFFDEIMTGLASGSGRAVLSNLTLALMEDSGWYVPDYSFGGFLGFGKGAGCDFVRNKCRSSSPAAASYYCSNMDGLDCTFNDLSLGRCEVNPLADGCGIVKGFGNYLCQDAENNEKGLPLQIFDSSSICVKGNAEPWKVQSRERNGGRVMTLQTTYPTASDGCFRFRCEGERVLVNLGSQELECPPGQSIDLTRMGLGFTQGTFGPCPGPDVCERQLSCQGRCNAMRGYCFQGKCHCHLGFFGHYCDQKLMPTLV